MFNINNKLFFLLLILILSEYIVNIILIPFNSYNPLVNTDEEIIDIINNSNDIDIIDSLSKNMIYSNLNISKDNQSIQTFIIMNDHQFYLKNLDKENETEPKEIDGYYNYTYNDNYILKNILKLNYYNSSLSNTYQFISNIPEDYYTIHFSFDKGVLANETFLFEMKNKASEQEIIKPISLLFTYRQSVRFDHRPGVIGLGIKKNDFLKGLKKSYHLKNYEFSIKFEDINKEKGTIIFGDSPHIYDEENYKEKDIRTAKVVKDYYVQWTLIFSNVYVDKSNYVFKKNEFGTFKIENFFILGTKEYFELIQNIFFNKYINENICSLIKYKKTIYTYDFFYFMCKIKNNKKKEEFFQNFPKLILFQKEMYYNFTFDAKDLFTIFPDDDRILFNVEFSNESKKWEFGIPFFKKYQLVFDIDSNLIKYYIKSNEIKDRKNNLNEGQILIIIMLVILVFIIGTLFGRLLCVKYNRKIRANELEDNYSYNPKNDDDKMDMKQINSKNENFITDEKEMSKLGLNK